MIKVTDIHKRFGDLEVLKGVRSTSPARSRPIVGAKAAQARPRCCKSQMLFAVPMWAASKSGQDASCAGRQGVVQVPQRTHRSSSSSTTCCPSSRQFSRTCLYSGLSAAVRVRSVERRAAELLEMMKLAATVPRPQTRHSCRAANSSAWLSPGRLSIRLAVIAGAGTNPSGNSLDSHNRTSDTPPFSSCATGWGQTVDVTTMRIHGDGRPKITMSDGQLFVIRLRFMNDELKELLERPTTNTTVPEFISEAT